MTLGNGSSLMQWGLITIQILHLVTPEGSNAFKLCGLEKWVKATIFIEVDGSNN
jgi:hypothetical protein